MVNPPEFILINTFLVPEAQQDALIALLQEFTESVTRHMPGFVSTTVHRGVDKTQVANYVRWQTRQDFDAMFSDPRSKLHMQEVQKMATRVTPIIYSIAYRCGESF